MALPCLCPRHMQLALRVCGYATLSGASRPQEKSGEPVFQYVGKHRKPTHKVFVWGFSFTGALGIPSFVVPDSGSKKPRRYQYTPYRLETAEQISSAACGYGFTLMASSTKDVTKLWGMGLNKDSQLGFQRTQHNRYKSYDYVLEPSPVALPLSQPQQTRVVQVSCGRAHSLVLTDHEGVFSMGNNAYGQCGRKIIDEEVYSGSHIIHRIKGFSSRVVQVACGQDHSLFLTDTGKVYSCGWGADGQTGLGHLNISSSPVEVGGELAGVDVQQINTYGDCSLAVSRDGQLFGWGNSEYRQLALATESTQQLSQKEETASSRMRPQTHKGQMNSPRHLPLKGCGKVVQAACGGTQVAVLNEKGEVFVWGYGILGKGPNLSESSNPERIPPTLFGRSEFNPSVAVVKIRCGLSHFAAVTDRGELFVWGKNVRGCLGIGKKDDQFFPWRVTVPGQVVDVACGVDHMVALVKSLL
ncbi:RCC1-like G exchanging factor-like protein isoform X1 [Poecilia formosa]|uniref:RCC1-like G exchanging factor-like protein isoform X1 n=1 Tax=Poecilia formosa TaxID=48698 RepID=UPI0007BA638C|nr:PREDICTED: Williams-Beuren syndrome chromosomal region 16 protein isoform X1 [Poecilia formosa]